MNGINKNDIPSPIDFRLAVSNAFNHIIITDPEGIVLYANPAVEKLTGYTMEEVVGNNPRLWGAQMDKEYYQKMWDTIKNKKQPFRGEIKNRRKNGEIYYAKVLISPILDDDGNLQGFIGTEEDITKQYSLEKALQKKLGELEEINDLLIDREKRMIELKDRIRVLENKLGLEQKRIDQPL